MQKIAEGNYLNLHPDCYEALMEKIRLVKEEMPSKEFNTLPQRITGAIRNDEGGELRSIAISLRQESGVVH
jgi:hypothetical protein